LHGGSWVQRRHDLVHQLIELFEALEHGPDVADMLVAVSVVGKLIDVVADPGDLRGELAYHLRRWSWRRQLESKRPVPQKRGDRKPTVTRGRGDLFAFARRELDGHLRRGPFSVVVLPSPRHPACP
jgi:hypothetical protein